MENRQGDAKSSYDFFLGGAMYLRHTLNFRQQKNLIFLLSFI